MINEDNYELVYYDKGDSIVVEDLFSTDYAYAQDIDIGERYEVRKKGIRLGRFENLESVEEFLEYF